MKFNPREWWGAIWDWLRETFRPWPRIPSPTTKDLKDQEELDILLRQVEFDLRTNVHGYYLEGE